MSDADEPGGSPACFVSEVDPGYQGYLVGDALVSVLGALLGREQVLGRLVAALQSRPHDDDGALGALAGAIAAATAALSRALASAPLPRSDDFLDEVPSVAQLGARERELVDLLRAARPRIASDALHADLTQALQAHETHLADLAAAHSAQRG
jgi:hypothetical protein